MARVFALLAVFGVLAPGRADDLVFNGVRVTAISAILVRIEPKGPAGFENRTTFMVENRSAFGSGIPIAFEQKSAGAATMKTEFYSVKLSGPSPPGPPSCSGNPNTDFRQGSRVSTCGRGAQSCLAPGATQAECCGNCTADKECSNWIYQPSSKQCYLMARVSGGFSRQDRVSGGQGASGGGGISAQVLSPSGAVIWSVSDLTAVSQNLNWPAPNNATVFAIKDFPRFYAPPWGPTPIPADQKPSIDPALVGTNGYDYRNNVDGDTYVFLLGDGTDIEDWAAGRRAFTTLAGPTPLLPDYAFGTWFTFWSQYTEDEAKGEVARWRNDDLPIDIWALDMNWRDTPHGHEPSCPDPVQCERHYNCPNIKLFPDFANSSASKGSGWFDFLKEKGVRTYFNDHPYPADNGKALQTTPDEVNFRWDGLTDWMAKGLTFWWFDANWAISIPPPNVAYGGHGDGSAWDGMDNRVWGSHVYYMTAKIYDINNPVREHTLPAQRPMALTKYADGNMHPGLVQHQHPAQHRYPVWWTGDGVDLEASVESMVDSGMYDFKPFVHSDCGGDRRGSDGDLLRWTAHCAFGSIHRFHGSDHRPWTYGNHTEDVIRTYLKMRYALMPSLIAAGQVATETAFPLVARGDFYWPDHANATSNHQYIHLNETLVAPIWDSSQNVTSRDTWVPPGEWQDVWTGDMVTGPKTVTSTLPYEQQPMWHRKGGFLITTSNPGSSVDTQDWSELTVEAFPSSTTEATTIHPFHARGSMAKTELRMQSSGKRGDVHFTISAAEDAVARAWVLRFHLRPGQRVRSASVDGVSAAAASIVHIPPGNVEAAFFPFKGAGSAPAPRAGHVAEIRLPSGSYPRSVSFTI